mmetsp:Transcript_92042/g.269302  ORF Transcript_92042/g.269302 Transcript_92042/m.269302 type:complete len:533 (+) Transcript_92042:90-1688(+)
MLAHVPHFLLDLREVRHDRLHALLLRGRGPARGGRPPAGPGAPRERPEVPRQLELQAVHALADVVAEVHHVFDAGPVAAAQPQHQLHELGEGDLLHVGRRPGDRRPGQLHRPGVLVREDGLRRGLPHVEEHLLLRDEILRIHAKVCQDHVHLRVAHEELELVLPNVTVVVLVVHLQDLEQVVLEIFHCGMLPLSPRHRGDHFAKYANQHIEEKEAAEEDEHHEEDGQEDRLVLDNGNLIGHSIQEGAMQQQEPHRRNDPRKLVLERGERLCVRLENYAEQVEQHQQQRQRDEDGAQGEQQSLQHGEDLRRVAEQPRHAAELGEPQKPGDAQHGEVPEASLAVVGAGEPHRQHDPRLAHHEDHQRRVEAEPAVPQAIPLAAVRAESDDQLDDEDRAEDVLRNLEGGVRVPDRRVGVQVRVHAQPEGVEQDHEHRGGGEPRAPSDPGTAAGLVVEVHLRGLSLVDVLDGVLLQLAVLREGHPPWPPGLDADPEPAQLPPELLPPRVRAHTADRPHILCQRIVLDHVHEEKLHGR